MVVAVREHLDKGVLKIVPRGQPDAIAEEEAVVVNVDLGQVEASIRSKFAAHIKDVLAKVDAHLLIRASRQAHDTAVALAERGTFKKEEGSAAALTGPPN